MVGAPYQGDNRLDAMVRLNYELRRVHGLRVVEELRPTKPAQSVSAHPTEQHRRRLGFSAVDLHHSARSDPTLAMHTSQFALTTRRHVYGGREQHAASVILHHKSDLGGPYRRGQQSVIPLPQISEPSWSTPKGPSRSTSSVRPSGRGSTPTASARSPVEARPVPLCRIRPVRVRRRRIQYML